MLVNNVKQIYIIYILKIANQAIFKLRQAVVNPLKPLIFKKTNLYYIVRKKIITFRLIIMSLNNLFYYLPFYIYFNIIFKDK